MTDNVYLSPMFQVRPRRCVELPLELQFVATVFFLPSERP